jgi:hypothetical protein
VRSYLTLTKDLGRVISRVRAIYRSWAIPCTGKQGYAPQHRAEWLAKITEPYRHGTSMGETIVRRMLEGQIAFAKDSGSTEISEGNYDFRFIREENVNGHHCYVLELSRANL